MADLITHSLSFTKESLREYFIKPLFVESDIRDLITVRTDLKTGEKLDLISELDKITKGYAKGTSFTASTGVTITQKTVNSKANGRHSHTSPPSTRNKGMASHKAALGSGLVNTSMKMMWPIAMSAPSNWMRNCAPGGKS